jgi:hypothetical protein
MQQLKIFPVKFKQRIAIWEIQTQDYFVIDIAMYGQFWRICALANVWIKKERKRISNISQYCFKRRLLM